MSVSVLNTFLQFPSEPAPELGSGPLLMSFDNRVIDKNGNYAVDDSNAGTLTYPTGKFDEAIQFADGNFYVAVGVPGDFAVVDDAILIEFYIRGTSFGFDSYIGQYDGANGWHLRDNNSDTRFGYELNGAGSNISNNIGQTSSFRLITFQYSAGNLSIWRDGVFFQTISGFDPAVFGKGQLTVGAVPLNPGFTSDNRLELDELRIVPGFAPYTDGVNFTPPTAPFAVEAKPHRYWRLNIKAVSDGGVDPLVRELTFLETVGQTTIGHTGTATASSQLDAFSAPSEAFDADEGAASAWIADGVTPLPQQLEIDLGAGNEIEVVGIRLNGTIASGDANNIVDFDVQFSDDGIEWFTQWSDSVNENHGNQRIWLSFDEQKVLQRLANNDFESGDKTGWTDGPSNATGFVVVASDSGGNTPNQGLNMLESQSLGDKEIYQDFDLTASAAEVDLGNVQYAMSGWQVNWAGDSDRGGIEIDFLDSGDAVISTVTDDTEQDSGWVPLSLQGVVPVGTRTIRAKAIATLNAGGTANISLDDLRLFYEEYVPDSVRINAINRYVIAKPLPSIRINAINRYVIAKPI